MKSHILNGRWAGLFLLVALALCIIPAGFAYAQGDPEGSKVILIISVDETFDADEFTKDGSETIVVQIGKLRAGQGLYNTRFEKKSGVEINLPKGLQWKKLDGHAYTILGSYNAPDASVHLMSPLDPDNADAIPRKVQEAYHLVADDLPGEFFDQFPTTVEIADFIYTEARLLGVNVDAPGAVPDVTNPTMTQWLNWDHSVETGSGTDVEEPSLSMEMILENLFLTDTDQNGNPVDTMDTTTDDVYAEGQGELFPHQPQAGDRLFTFDLSIEKKKKKAKLESNMVIDVEIDIKPGNADNVIEKSDNGVVWAAILTTTAFDAAAEVDWDTVKLGNATAKDFKIEDADHDGNDDITLKFNVADIGLTSTTTTLTMTGTTNFDPNDDKLPDVPMSFTGSDAVTVKK